MAWPRQSASRAAASVASPGRSRRASRRWPRTAAASSSRCRRPPGTSPGSCARSRRAAGRSAAPRRRAGRGRALRLLEAAARPRPAAPTPPSRWYEAVGRYTRPAAGIASTTSANVDMRQPGRGEDASKKRVEPALLVDVAVGAGPGAELLAVVHDGHRRLPAAALARYSIDLSDLGERDQVAQPLVDGEHAERRALILGEVVAAERPRDRGRPARSGGRRRARTRRRRRAARAAGAAPTRARPATCRAGARRTRSSGTRSAARSGRACRGPAGRRGSARRSRRSAAPPGPSATTSPSRSKVARSCSRSQASRLPVQCTVSRTSGRARSRSKKGR